MMTRHAKNLTLVFALLLVVVHAGAAGTIRQLFYSTDAASMAAEPNVSPGNAVVVGSASASQKVFFGFPQTRTADNVHVYNGKNGVQWVDMFRLLSLDNITLSQLAGCAAGYTLVGNGTTLACSQISDASVSNSAAISVGKLSLGSANTVLGSNGSFNFWTQITGPYIQDATVPWTKLSTFPTITAMAPLLIDGGASANLSTGRTLSISPASSSSPGSISSAHYTRLEKIPDPTTDKMGYILTPSGLSETYTLQPPANMGILTTTTGISGSGSAGYIPKFSGTRTLTNSKLFENSNGIAIGHTNAEGPLDIRGSSGNTSLTLYDTTNPNAHFLLVSSAPEAGAGLFYLVNGSTSAIPLGIKHSGEVGINTIGPTATLDVNGTFRWRGGSPAAGYLMAATDSNGNATWSSTAGLGLFKNGDSYAILSDGLKLSATGVDEIRGSSIGYTTQLSSGSGKDITMRAQSTNDGAAGQRGGNVDIYAGSAPLNGSATQGEITLITGSGVGDAGVIAKTTKFSRNGVSGWVAVKSPSVPVYEEQQWSSATTAGNAQGTIWFNSWDGVIGIPNDTYRLEFDVIATRTDGGAGAYAAKLIATVVKQGGSITQTALRTVYKDSALVFDWSSPAPDAVALLFNQTGSAAYNHKWIVKASIIREP